MTTKIGRVLALLESASKARIHEAKMAGKLTRRIFFNVVFRTTEGDEQVIVEAPSKALAVSNASLLIQHHKPAMFALVSNVQDTATASVYSAFTPADIPFIDTLDPTAPERKQALFKAAKTELAKAALRNNKSPYVMPNIAMMQPDADKYVLVPAYEVPKYVEQGYAVVGKDGARRRQGYSDTPYGN